MRDRETFLQSKSRTQSLTQIFAVKNVCNLQETRHSKEGRDTLASPSNPTPWLKQFANILPLAILSYSTCSQTQNFELTSYRTYFVDSNISTFRPSSYKIPFNSKYHTLKASKTSVSTPAYLTLIFLKITKDYLHCLQPSMLPYLPVIISKPKQEVKLKLTLSPSQMSS